MSLEELDEIYRLYEVPLEKRFAELRKQIARSRTQQPTKGNTKLDQGSQGLNSYNYIKVLNDHYNIKLHDLGTSEYFAGNDPDFSNQRLNIQTDHFGHKLFDDSQCPSSIKNDPVGQDITCWGEPRLEGGFDRGYGDPTNSKGRQALHFNRDNSTTQWHDWIQVREQATTDSLKSVRVVDNTRLSYLIRLKLDSGGLASNGSQDLNVTLFHHYNDSSNNTRIFLGTGGNLRWSLEKGGVQYSVDTADGVLTTGTDVELGFAWDNGGATDADKFKFYKNGVLQATQADSVGGVSTGSTDLFIGKRGSGDGGFVKGHIIVAKVWRGTTLAASAYLRHFTNKLTIDDIAYGKVATAEESVPRNL